MLSRPAASPQPSPTLRSFAKGEVLWQEGDPPGPLYVIRSGQVRAYRGTAATIEELARLGPGQLVGEMAALLQTSRSATVQALEPTELLEVPVTQVRGLLKQHKALQRVLTAALQERAGLSPSEVESIVSSRHGDVASASAPAAYPAPEHDAAIVYPKRLTCPVCSTQFFTLVVHPQQDRPSERSSDFHQRYRTAFNPYDYELWVCPHDLYAALPADFPEISDLQQPRVAEVVADVVAHWGGVRPDFNADRGLDLRQKGLELSLALYHMRRATPLRIAAVQHRLAWCERERGNTDAERRWLAQALQSYMMAYNFLDEEHPKTVVRVAYLCAELNFRLGEVPAGVRWSSEGLRHPAIKEHPHWERLLREQWSNHRASRAA